MGLVLIVDDDVDIINLVKKYLGDEGHQVMSAVNPIDAQEIINKFRVTLAIVDVNMPFQNGFDFVEQTRRSIRNRFMPVLFLTGRSDKKDIERARKLDIEGYMLKPFDKKTFVEKVNALIKKHEAAAPAYSAVDVTSKRIHGNLVVTYSIVIESISEVGLSLICEHDVGDLEKNPDKVVELIAPLWALLNVEPVKFTINSRTKLPDRDAWRFTLFYDKPNQEALDGIKRWIQKNG